MRAFDRDLIRGEHYGQRPSVPRSKAEHMAAPTNAAGVKKALANPEPSTHGPEPKYALAGGMSAFGSKPDQGSRDRRLPLLTQLGLTPYPSSPQHDSIGVN